MEKAASEKEKMNIHILTFKPFGLHGLFMKRNFGQEVARKIHQNLEKTYNSKITFGVLPVNEECIKITKEFCAALPKKDIILIFGEAPYEIGVRAEPYAKKDGRKIMSKLHWQLDSKKKLGGVFTKAHIGNWYCNDVYRTCLLEHGNTLFFHCGFFSTNEIYVGGIIEMARWLLENGDKDL